ncbi:MAG: hypothetical protein LBG80_08455 [Bacteroidales bacterium]|jgi:hypothetical protein|nr:hypothetical protein [Bacteroidales bacterium]
MKAKLLLLTVFLLTSVCSLLAQEQERKKNIGYSNISEIGFATTSPRGCAFEATSVNGISINKEHHLGLGVGYGGSFYVTYYAGTAYTPVFFNYRFYFKPEKKFSPHINMSAGGLFAKDGEGFYSSLTAGFKAGKFSFSSGISFMAIYRKEEAEIVGCRLYDPSSPYADVSGFVYSYSNKIVSQWHSPFGITIKCGFTL